MKNKAQLLVIEDDETVSKLLTTFFEDNGFKVEAVSKGDSALRYLEKHQPNLIITDLLLPGEHGIKIIKTVKEKYSIPVIVISGVYHKDEISHVIKDLSVERYFKKPLVLNEMLKKVETILNG